MSVVGRCNFCGPQLCAGAVTCIWGPPGTGKTCVIAEIASQVARHGGRVLISSQSNLAVDNALEHVIDSDDVFRVRVGRPESVTLNPELLLEYASDRYRQQLLRKSVAVFDEERQAIDKLPQITDRKDLDILLRDVRDYAQTRAEIYVLGRSVADADQLELKTSCKFHSAERELQSVLDQAGLVLEQLPDFIDVSDQLLQRHWDPADVCSRGTNIALHNKVGISTIPAWHLGHRSAHDARLFAEKRRMPRFLQTERLAWVFELAFPMNSHHDIEVSRRSQ